MKRSDIVRASHLLYSSWVISRGESDEKAFPRRDVLTSALEKVINKGAFPEWFRKGLTFVDGRTGRICIELPEIEQVANDANLKSDPNPSYRRTQIEATAAVAERLLILIGVPVSEAARWGRELREAVSEMDHAMAE